MRKNRNARDGYALDLHTNKPGAGNYPIFGEDERGKNPGLYRPPSEDQLKVDERVDEVDAGVDGS